jgi:hypothetical protein
MVGTRPDIVATVGVVAQFFNNPRLAHWQAVKRLLRYLQGLQNLVLGYSPDLLNKKTLELCGFCDSDWGGDVDTRRSTTGYVFLLGGAPVSWASKKQSTISLSSTKAEYMACTHATMEVLWLRRFLGEVGYMQKNTTFILSDSQGSSALLKSLVHHLCTKHIDVQFHFVREHIAFNEVLFDYCSTKEMAAYIFTKAVSRD